jgi:prohibitin 2
MDKRLAVLAVLAASGCSCYVVEPTERGVKVSLGDMEPNPIQPGWDVTWPWVDMHKVSLQQQTREVDAPCFSADLQQVQAHLKVLYRVPESSVIKVYRDYAGNPFDALIAPRVQEALKEVTAGQTAEQIAKQREAVKQNALESARKKVGDLLVVEDLVIENLDLSDELEKAIESKMVQEQEAAKAKFTQQQAEIDAKTAAIRAQGAADAIRIQGQALRADPAYVQYLIASKWNGVAPLVVGAGDGASVLLPMAGTK